MSFINYTSNLNNALNTVSPDDVNVVYDLLLDCKKNNNTLYFCGNGGSAGNANHLANDFIYGVAKKTGEGFKVQSLSANSSVLTCLANDVGYQNIYSEQIEVLGAKNDGYSFFWESLYLLNKKKYSIKEIPIYLPYRKVGSSKMTMRDIIGSLFYLFKYSIKNLIF